MPATEQTWRSTQLLHRIFMVSSLAMLGTTIWMLYADHNREWKQYQDTSREIDLAYNEWTQIQYKTDAKLREHAELSEAYAAAQGQPIEAASLQAFQDEVNHDARERELADYNFKKINSLQAEFAEYAKSADAAQRERAQQTRANLVTRLRDFALAARFRENVALDTRKKRSALLDAAKAKLDIAVRDSHVSGPDQQKQKDQQTLDTLQSDVDGLKHQLDELTLKYQQAAAHRKRLDEIIGRITAAEVEAKKSLEVNQAELKGLETAYKQRDMNYVNLWGPIPLPGKKLLTIPILDAFNSPRKIDNLWSDGLMIDYNFAKVRRFDRCTTCHQSLEKSQPGAADKPLYVKEQTLALTLKTPTKDEKDALQDELKVAQRQFFERNRGKGAPPPPTTAELLEQFYGLRLAGSGLLESNHVIINYVKPKSLAARAELARGDELTAKQSGGEIRDALMYSAQAATDDDAAFPTKPGLVLGDVIVRINNDTISNRRQAERLLLESVAWGKPLAVQIRRGMPDPYTSHPRLDLFVGSLSPHRAGVFACTICHEGQGSATAFKWASHTPDNPRQRQDWAQAHGWVDNHHWIFPMYPQRFAESACLKCHHEVVELEPSERFPDAPAPKVTHGYHVVRKYGCYGCHEINGFDGPTRRVGPDLRSEPNFFAAALQLQHGPDFEKLSADEKQWLAELVDHPELAEPRHRLFEVLAQDEKAKEHRFLDATYKLAAVLKDVEAPGDLRKPGPSLRYVAQKLDDAFLFDWIREPKHFRPNSRMPQFFGLHGHLEGASKVVAQKFEPMEILGIVTYLKQRSQAFEYLPRAAGIAKSPAAEQVARGKIAFQERGCLACHVHKDFPEVAAYRQPNEIVQGPDLSNIGTKFDKGRNAKGRDWLYSWIKQPTRYHARTVMPDLFLEPIPRKDENGQVIAVTDPAADLVDFLLSSTGDWTPRTDTFTKIADDAQRKDLDAIVREHLKDTFYEEKAERVLVSGLPERERKDLKGAETELIVSAGSGRVSDEQKLIYLGRKTIAKQGCYGCHDIPGFEDSKPIGTALADWGKKEPAKLAFEHIAHYLQGHGQAAHGNQGNSAGHAEPSEAKGAHVDRAVPPASLPEFYKEQLDAVNRTGFIWQKLVEPRSYDFRKTENKKYNERLRMPQFSFNDQEREALITFVLGLVADPPASKFVYQPNARKQALIEGRKTLDKYNCAGCHLLETEKWNIVADQGSYQPQDYTSYPFLAAHFPADQISTSAKPDHRGQVRATLSGMPTLADADAKPIIEDAEGEQLEPSESYDPATLQYRFDLWGPALLEGNPYNVGVMPTVVRAGQIEKKYLARGGVLARYLLPHVLQRERLVNSQAKGSETWAWVPPPLVGEGQKVQSNWLHDFLLNPYSIRPAVVLRMPRFNMSSQEATSLVKYFSAVDHAEYPYEYSQRRQSQHLTAAEAAYSRQVVAGPQPAQNKQADEAPANSAPTAKPSRFDDALKVITNGNYCIKCHVIADFEPKGADRAKAPNLARVHERLRADYVRNWIANPKSILPYTSMPLNIPYDANAKPYLGGVSQDLYHGTSVEQVDALVDLLMNYDTYAKQRSLIAPLVQQNAPPPTADPPATEKTESGGNN